MAGTGAILRIRNAVAFGCPDTNLKLNLAFFLKVKGEVFLTTIKQIVTDGTQIGFRASWNQSQKADRP